MAVVEFACPHCNERFELENPPAGEHVACPLCGGMLAIPADLPTEYADTGALEFVGRDDVEAAPAAFDVGELAPSQMLPHRRKSAASQQAPAIVPLSREEKERRRQLRTFIWMIGGGLLLAIAAAVLSRL